MTRLSRQVYGALTLALGMATTVAAQLTDQQAAAAKAVGEAGRARDVVVLCFSNKMKEGALHPGLAAVEMRISGATGDIAMKAYEAKRRNQQLPMTEDLKTWHLTAIAHPTGAAIVQRLALRSSNGDTAPADTFVQGPPVGRTTDAIASFTSPAARELVERGENFESGNSNR